jgi:hypothetical protein
MTAVNGYRWAIGVTDNASRLLFVVALLGGPVVVVALGRFPWPWVAVGVGLTAIVTFGEGAYRTWEEAMSRPPLAAADPPAVRMDESLLTDSATARHLVYFRLRFWNDGGGAVTPEVRVTDVRVADEARDARFSPQLPLPLAWSHHKTPPRLTRQHTAGETVGVLGALSFDETSDGVLYPVDPPALYIAGLDHHASLGQIDDKVFIKVQAIAPNQPVIEKWFWVQVEKADGPGYRVTSGTLTEAPS